jgi:lactoylglutathione lyase
MIKKLIFEHLAIPIKDLPLSLKFYRDILGLPTLERPKFDFDGAWLDLGDGLQLHLMVQDNFEVVSGTKLTHFAFTIEAVEHIQDLCETHQIEFVPIKTRSDGVQQFFIKDPNGWFVEFNSRL